MRQLGRKHLATLNDKIAWVEPPLTDTEIAERDKDCPIKTRRRFAFNHRENLYRPAKLPYRDQVFDIQVNHCTNPFCQWFGMPQAPLPKKSRRGKRTWRYKIIGSSMEAQAVSDENQPEEEEVSDPSFGDDSYDRYRVIQTKRGQRRGKIQPERVRDKKRIACNQEDIPSGSDLVFSDYTVPMTNCGTAEEIARLATH